MATDPYRLGYVAVDADAHAEVLVENMRTNAAWEATVELREWERARLRLQPGERVLDVGCGRGEAVLALGADEIVGMDASERMLEVAAAHSPRGPSARFVVGDAMELAFRADSFDAVRSERVLQWLPQPSGAVAEMTRVLKPNGRLSLIDTDWSTFSLDVGDPEIARRVHARMSVERNRPSHVGRRLGDLVADAGLRLVHSHSATQVWTAWDPDTAPTPFGCFSMRSLAEDLDGVDVDAVVSTIEAAARAGAFRMQLTMHAVIAAAPPS